MIQQQSDKEPLLRGELRGFQILFISLSAVIGNGVLVDYGETLAIAGPIGLLLSVVILGVVACSVAETVSGFVQIFPARNAVYEFTYYFLDKDLAWVVSLGYWYCFTAVFAAEMVGAASRLTLWNAHSSLDLTSKGGLAVYLFYSLIPTILFTINLCGVWLFGWIETVGGVLKTFITLGASFSLFKVAASSHAIAFHQHPAYDGSFGERLCVAIPGVAYSYVGIESIIMAAFEGKPGPQKFTLKNASQLTHWIVFAIYLLYTAGTILAVRWDSEPPSKIIRSIFVINDESHISDLESNSPVIIAMRLLSGSYGDSLVSFTNVCLIFCSLSAANTSLYIASRTMWGMVTDKKNNAWLQPIFDRLATLGESTGVPVFALLLSTWFILSVFPSTQFTSIADEAVYVLSATASESCIVVWLAISLSFLNFCRWAEKYPQIALESHRPPHGSDRPSHSRIGRIPIQRDIFWLRHGSFAAVGVLGSVLVIICSSASLWRSDRRLPSKIVGAFGAQAVMLIAWMGTKGYRSWPGKSENDDFIKTQRERYRHALETLRKLCARHKSDLDTYTTDEHQNEDIELREQA